MKKDEIKSLIYSLECYINSSDHYSSIELDEDVDTIGKYVDQAISQAKKETAESLRVYKIDYANYPQEKGWNRAANYVNTKIDQICSEAENENKT